MTLSDSHVTTWNNHATIKHNHTTKVIVIWPHKKVNWPYETVTPPRYNRKRFIKIIIQWYSIQPAESLYIYSCVYTFMLCFVHRWQYISTFLFQVVKSKYSKKLWKQAFFGVKQISHFFHSTKSIKINTFCTTKVWILSTFNIHYFMQKVNIFGCRVIYRYF